MLVLVQTSLSSLSETRTFNGTVEPNQNDTRRGKPIPS